ncbi:glutamate racemase [Marinobacter caseinilyticus]|uniref:glutamate racemase n=1 Tax=Marinobacter caseinilyticus TaxID=2692195 RepID=UPI001409A717|nr:glutamate racemase [Marinobacter caseinilyticus]
MRHPSVLIFDSGVGGLSVAQCIRQRVPSAQLTYLADNACFPYGDQAEATVISRCVALVVEALTRSAADVIVVACNTASTAVLPSLRAAVSVPVVGVVPAIKPASLVSENRRIGLLATPATVTRPYLEHLINEFAGDCRLERVGHPDLVRWIEAWVAGQPLSERLLKDALAPFRRAEVDTVVLGCTHYPLILDRLQAVLPEIRFWVDSGDAIARRTLAVLQEAGLEIEALPASAPPLNAVFFTGEVPTGIAGYLTHIGLAARSVEGGWPGQAHLTTVGSA